MARRKKKNGGRRNPMTRAVNFIFDVLGIFVAASPAVDVLIRDIPAGNFQSLPNDVLFAYTGLGGTTPINTDQTIKGIGAIVGGAVVASVPSVYRWVKARLRGR